MKKSKKPDMPMKGKPPDNRNRPNSSAQLRAEQQTHNRKAGVH